MHKNTIYVDSQLLQTSAWERGMGKYSLNLLAELSKLADLTLIFNANLHKDEERISFIREKISPCEIVFLDLPAYCDIKAGKKISKKVLDNFFKTIDKDFTFLQLSVFTFDYAAVFPERGARTAILYDLIPIRYWDEFRVLYGARTYFEQFKLLYQADTLYCISDSVKKDAINILGISEDKLVNIAGAHIPRLHVSSTSSKKVSALGLNQNRFILFPSGDMPHKNNERTIRAFEKFNRVFGYQFKLVVTSTFSDKSVLLLSQLSPNVIFTGNLSDSEFNNILERCEFVLFTSLVEGLGLPILEATNSNKPVVCSNIDAHKEISEKAYYYCDPADIESIKDAMFNAIQHTKSYNQEKYYSEIRNKFTWDSTAKRLNLNIPPSRIKKKQKKECNVYIVLPNLEEISRDINIFMGLLSRDLDVKVLCPGADNSSPIIAPYIFNNLSLRKFLHANNRIYIIANHSQSINSIVHALIYGGKLIVFCVPLVEIVKDIIRHGYIGLNSDKPKEISDVINEIITILNKKVDYIYTTNSNNTKYGFNYVGSLKILSTSVTDIII